jgi:Uma2 family endonuclease
MVLEITRIEPFTIEQFKAWAEQPEFADRSFELIDGEIVEKMPGTTLNSGIAVKIVINTLLYQHRRRRVSFRERCGGSRHGLQTNPHVSRVS